MGLLGVVVEVSLQLRRVPSPFVEVTTIPVRDLSESIDTLERSKERSDCLIAWVDAFAKGSRLGRGTVEIARWLDVGQGVARQDL
ncbi:FAD-binding protein, partial [Acidobacteriia bacterium AH_259_A11_L15]|nr:FAD-binding protein [Acidobacteriia bacterium AH_259_A11_L15]